MCLQTARCDLTKLWRPCFARRNIRLACVWWCLDARLASRIRHSCACCQVDGYCCTRWEARTEGGEVVPAQSVGQTPGLCACVGSVQPVETRRGAARRPCWLECHYVADVIDLTRWISRKGTRASPRANCRQMYQTEGGECTGSIESIGDQQCEYLLLVISSMTTVGERSRSLRGSVLLGRWRQRMRQAAGDWACVGGSTWSDQSPFDCSIAVR